MANLESSNSPQVKLFREWGQGIQTRDLGLISKGLHKDFRFVVYPRSLGKPEQTREEWLGQIAGVLKIWTADPEVSYFGCSNLVCRD